MKKLIAIILSVIMTVSVLPFAAFANFKDVEDGKWYSDGIEYCVTNRYMAGVLDGTFDRNGALTRAMFVLILARLDGVDLEDYANIKVFDDVETDKWYSAAVAWAAENGLASGIGDNQFGYKNPVTREQMALFLYAYSVYFNNENADLIELLPEYLIDTESRTDLSIFVDADRVHDWARDAMEWAVAVELFSGVGENTLDPRGNCTRAQTAVLIRAYEVNVIYDFCEHNWVEPTCELPGMCTECPLYYAHEIGHNFDSDGYCLNCGQGPCEHQWTEPTCNSASYCELCYEKNPDGTLGDHEFVNGFCKNCYVQDCDHVWSEPTCAWFSYCEKCFVYNPNGFSLLTHKYVDGICTVCGKEKVCSHEWSIGDCETISYCTKCQEVNIDMILAGHNYVDNVCTVCGKEEICTHDWIPATCGMYGFCKKCQEENGEPLEHSFVDGVCTNCSALHDETLSAFDNIAANIQAHGIEDEKGNKYLSTSILELTGSLLDTNIFMKPDDPDNIYSTFKMDAMGTYVSLELTIPRDFDELSFTSTSTSNGTSIFDIDGNLVITENIEDLYILIDSFVGSSGYSSEIAASSALGMIVSDLVMAEVILAQNTGVSLADLGLDLGLEI